MMSVEQASDHQGNNGSTKLPYIQDGISLVSPVTSARAPNITEQVKEWAQEVRQRLDHQLRTINEFKESEIEEDDVTILKTELVSLAIRALQKDDRKSWMFFREAVLLVKPYVNLIKGKQEIKHYLERINDHLEKHKERLFDLQVIEAIQKVFLQDIQEIVDSGAKPAKLYCVPTPPRSLAPTSPRKLPPPSFRLPDGKNPYQLERPDDPVNKKPKGLTFGDLRRSIPDVALEVASRDAIWSTCLGNTAQALLCDLPDLPEEDRGESASRTSSQLSGKSQEDHGEEEERVESEYDDLSEEAQEIEDTPLNGREAVEYFSKCYHTGKIKFMYFNVAPNRRYMPYNLIQVHKDKTNKEHYVFSTFGVLHVFPDQPSENMSLADWQKEAVLFKATLHIPFFKHYLIKKMFDRWKRNVHFADYASTHKSISTTLLQGVPSFGTALLQVAKLCMELLYLKFLPIELHKCYELGQFENVVNYMRLQAQKVLDRFFRYNKTVVTTTSEETFKKLKHCEEQVRHKTVFTKESLYIQRKKKEQREENLRDAKLEAERLGNFVQLVDQMLLSHLVKLAIQCVTKFVHETMEMGADAPRDGLFTAKLVFGKEEKLTISPRKEKFQRALNKTLNEIPILLCESAVALDGSMQIVSHGPEDFRDLELTPMSRNTKSSSRITQAITSARQDIGRKSTLSRRSQVTFDPTSASSPGQRNQAENVSSGDMIQTPDLSQIGPPSKSRDEFGQATPDLLEPSIHQSTVIKGSGFVGHYRPLTKGNLEEKLVSDETYKEAMKTQERLMLEAIDEIDEYCSRSGWLNEIFLFCTKWITGETVMEWRGSSGFAIEQKLSEIRQWTEKARQFDPNYTTDNGIFYLDCSGVQDYLVPKLAEIYEELCLFVVEESMTLAKKFCNEMKEVLQNMKNKQTDIGGFADYAKNVAKYKRNQRNYQERMEYIKGLFEVIRMSYRQLEQNEEKLEENILAMWDAFLVAVQDATDFVNVQTPLITQNLEDIYQRDPIMMEIMQRRADHHKSKDGSGKKSSKSSSKFKFGELLLLKLEEQAKVLCTKATTGKFLDPDEKPTKILIEMAKLKEEYNEINKQMVQASKWKEAITTEPYDLKTLNQIGVKMSLRQEIWLYVEVSTYAIIEWKGMLFRKLNCKKVLDKLQEWQGAAGQLKPHLPAGDKVLASWYRALNDFKKDLPLLHKLSSDALKPRHWKTIFLGMGEVYDQTHQFTVEELLAYNLGTHAEVITTVYAAAVSEFAIERKIVKIRKLWLEKEFKLAKHIPESIYKDYDLEDEVQTIEDSDGCPEMSFSPTYSEDENQSRTKTPPQSKRSKRYIPKVTASDKDAKIEGRSLELYAEHLYVLIEMDDLKYWLEDSQVTLQAMLQSPFLADHRIEAEYWYTSLGTIEQIIDLWVVCQQKWLYLLKVFDEPEMYRRLEKEGTKFQDLHLHLVEYMQSVTADPRVTSMLPKTRGDRNWRLHQGEKLKELLREWIQSEEEILTKLHNTIDRSRSQFPRLYFLSNEELVELLGISRNPRALLPFAKKCFKGVVNLSYDLPHGTATMNSALDFALNADKLEVTKVEGLMGEELVLYTRLKAIPQATKWLSTLDKYIKTTMLTIMEACIQARLEDGSKPFQLLEELATYEAMKSNADGADVDQILAEIHHSFSHWILRFPAQCVLAAEAVMWERIMFKALEKSDMDEIKMQKLYLQNRVDQYGKVLRENCLTFKNSDMRRRLHYMLGNLINQSMYHRDVMDRLTKNPVLSDSVYDWMKVLRYHMEIRNVLQAKTDHKEFRDDMDISNIPETDGEKERRTSVVKPVTQHRGLEDLGLNRAHTGVTTGYQFGQCMVSQMGATFIYDHEYLGPAPRLVFTPLTERAFLSLTIAMKSFTCGTLIGPSGTGKSETIRDLAKAMGRHIVNVNCNEDLTLPKMNRYLNGMIQSGSWALFDDTDRMTQGLMSVFAQQLDYLSNAMRVLDTSSDNQYGIRGQPRFDKCGFRVFYDTLHGEREEVKLARQTAKPGDKKIRRNSLTTLHSLPASEWTNIPVPPLGLDRQTTVPHGFNEDGLITYFEESWVKERERRHSIEKEIEIKESELYKTMRPPPLFYEHVTLRRKPKRDFKDLVLDYVPYKPKYIGNVLFNGKLIQANANFGCFMTLNSADRDHSHMPNNIRLCMRPCALVIPERKAIIEAILLCNGFQKYKPLAAKLNMFYDLISTQLPRSTQYDFGLKTLNLVLQISSDKLHDYMNHQHHNLESRQKRSKAKLDTKDILESSDLAQCEESSLLLALKMVLLPKVIKGEDSNKIISIMKDVFPTNTRPKSGIQAYSQKLVQAIQDQMKQDSLLPNDDIVLKILHLYSAMELKQGIIVTGICGTGKTTMYKILSKVLTKLHSKDSEEKVEDDLIPEKTLISQHAQASKLGKTNEPEDVGGDEVLRGSEKEERAGAGRGLWDKFKKISTFGIALQTMLDEAEEPYYPKVDLDIVYSNALNPKQLFGYFKDQQIWESGVLANILRNAQFRINAANSSKEAFDVKKNKLQLEVPSVIQQWIVLDGSLNHVWVDNMNTLLDSERKLSLANGENIQLQDDTQVIFELTDMSHASPCTVGRCTVIHCQPETVSWKALFECWGHLAKQRWVINALSFQVLQSLVNSTFGSTITFLQNECMPAGLQNLSRAEKRTSQIVPGLKEVSSFLNILSSLLDRHLLREDFESKEDAESNKGTPEPVVPSTAESNARPSGTAQSSRSRGSRSQSGKGSRSQSGKSRSEGRSSVARVEDGIPNYMAVIKAMFGFSYIWGFGGNLNDESWPKFDAFARDTLRLSPQSVYIPKEGTVYDYFVEPKSGIFTKWSEKQVEKSRNTTANYTIIPEIDRFSFLSDLLLSTHKPVLITGDPGVGKSSLIDHLIATKHPYTQVTMSPELNSQRLQHQLLSRLTDIKAATLDQLAQGPKTERELERHLFFIEDLNFAQSDGVTGTMPSLELVRQILSERQVYHIENKTLTSMEECNFIAAATHPGILGTGHGYACHSLPVRLTRLFTVFTMFAPNEEFLHSIFTPTMLRWLEEFPTKAVEHHSEFAKALVQGVLDMYVAVKHKLRPTPAQSHYIFTLHDIAQVFSGMLLMSPRSKIRPKHKKAKEILVSRQSDIRSLTQQSFGQGSFKMESPPPPVVEERVILPMMRVIARLWCHECTRTFGDRIIGEEEVRWFEITLEDSVLKNFCSGADEWRDKMSTIPEDVSRRATPAGVPLLPKTPPPPLGGEGLLDESGGEADDETQTVTSINTVGISKENTMTTMQSEQPLSPRSEGVATVQAEALAPSPAKDSSTDSALDDHTERDDDEESEESESDKSSEESSEDEDEDESDEEEDVGSTADQQKDPDTGEATIKKEGLEPTPPKSPKPASRDGSVAGASSRLRKGSTGSQRQESSTSARDYTELTSEGSDLTRNSSTDGHSKTPTSQGSKRDGAVKKRSSKGGPGQKRGVTFKAGLIADKVVEKYTGPLMSLEQIKDYGEKLTDFMFTKFIMTMHAEHMGGHSEKGYVEVGEEYLTDALYTCSREYNKFVHQYIDVVFFKEAVRHAARLSRVLATPGGHAVLLSMSYTCGRTTLVRLAAHFANAKMYEPKIQVEGSDRREILHEHMKRLSKSAAFHGKSVVLLLHEDMGDECIEDACAFMKQGLCPGLYTDDDIQNLATQMNPGQVRTTRMDKIETMFEKFLKRIKQNVHIVVCLNYHAGVSCYSSYTTLRDKMSKFPALINSSCHMDLYTQWNHEAFVCIAEHWLRDTGDMIPVPWSDHSRGEQICLVSTAMSYIHNSAKVSIDKLYSHQRIQYKFFTPLTYMEFVHIFKIVSAYIAKRERENIHKYNLGLAKINEAFDSIADFKKEVSDLIPEKKAALNQVQEHTDNVEKQRDEYIQALERCKEVEADIERRMTPLEKLRHDAQAEFDRVNPTYHAALRALKSLDKKDVIEMKSFRAPPEGVTLVMDAVCLLFNEEQTWENAKILLMKDIFFEELEFYDKGNIPEAIFKKLKEYIMMPEFQVDTIMCQSKASGGLCKWVHAVYWYSEISRKMKPKISELIEAEEELGKAQALLGMKRVEANRIKSALETEIRNHKAALARQKVVDKQIQIIEKRIGKANHLMDNMEMQHDMWRSELRLAKGKIKTAPGDALLTAACICYHGPLDNRTRADLMNDWMSRCDLGNFDPTVRFGRQVKPVSLSAKLESLLKPTNMSGTESVHSIQQAESYQAGDGYSTKADDSMSQHETELGGDRPSTAMSQMSVYKHQPSIYDTSIMYKTELRTMDQLEGLQHADLESVDASSTSFRNLLAVRENFTLQNVLSHFDELSDWKIRNLPTDIHSLHNALIMRVCCHNRMHCWPLLVDPDNQAEMWVTALQEGGNIIRDDDIINNQLLTKLGMIREEDERPMTGNSDHETIATDFDDSHSVLHSTTISLYSSRATTRQSHHRPLYTRYSNISSEDYRPVTSIAFGSNDQFAGKVDDSIERPENNLWIIASDDPELEKCLLNAIFHGVTVMITHIERKSLDPLFRGLLMKQFMVDDKGNQIIRVGDTEFVYHPDFCLYLCTSSTLFMKGDGMVDLPVEKMCVLDMAISQEGVTDKVLYEIMRVERPEFEGQKKSIESDLLHHQHELNREHDIVLEKTLNLAVPLLDEKTMLEALINCQKNVERNQMILEETQYLRQHLEEKSVNYNPVAMNGAKLFEIVQRCSVLNPLYHMPFEYFSKLYAKTVQSRNRGKGSTGHPKARAQELINATTSVVYNVVSSMMFEHHTYLFALLVTLERLRMEQKLTNQELGLFVNGVDTSEIEDNIVFDDKPTWLTNKVWLDCAALETTLASFKGLRDSFKKYSLQWQEYFKCPVVLMNSLPGERLASLTVFQKCLLWRICAAQKMLDVCEALVLHELGGVISPPKGFNVQEVFEQTDKSVPVVCILPAALTQTAEHDSIKAHPFSSPVYEILQYAKEIKMEGKVHIVTCGVSSQSREIHHALEDCMTAGYWLVIQNAHLGEPMTKDLLEIIKEILLAKPIVIDEDEIGDDAATEVTEASSRFSKASAKSIVPDRIHKDFRLWITTRSDEGRLIPGMIIQHGLKVTCETTHNLKDTLDKSYKLSQKIFSRRDRASIAIKQVYGKSDYVTPIALFHAVMVHRRNYRISAFASDSFWTHVDLNSAIEQMRIIVTLTQRTIGISNLVELIYGGHCSDTQDRKTVEALCEALLLAPKDIKALPEEVPGVAKLLKQLQPQTATSFFQCLDEVTDVNADTINLPLTADTEHKTRRSRNLVDDLVRVVGAPDLLLPSVEITNRKAEMILLEVEAIVDSMPDVPETAADAFYPMDMFYHSETTVFKNTIQVIQTDTQHLLSAARGEIASTSEIQELLQDISQKKVPLAWQQQSYPSCVPLIKWMSHFKERLELLTCYLSDKDNVPVYNMAVFHRPDRFIQCVLQTFARKEFKELHGSKLDVQFLPMNNIKPSSPPKSGVYIDGLWLNNAAWNNGKSALKDCQAGYERFNVMPVIWLKPMSQTEFTRSRAEIKYELYDCPILFSPGTKCLLWTNIIASLELPSLIKASVWGERRVYLTCALRKMN